MNVLLVYPYYPYASVSTFEEPVGILYLASSLLEAGHKVEVVDLTFNREMEGLAEKVYRADVVGVSAPTPLFGTADIVLNYIKNIRPDVPSIVGGPHATANPYDALSSGFDVAVIGEGEVTIVELAKALEEKQPLEDVAGIAYLNGDKVRFTPVRPFIPDLDDITFPARQFIDYSQYRRLGIISMRGCPYRCLYCKPVEEKLFGRKLRRRSLENVVEEIDELIKMYGNRQISFKDDTLTVNNTEWFERLGEELRRRRPGLSWQCSSRVDTVDFGKLEAMKKAGCRQIFFGIESGSQRILDYYQKDIKVERIIETFALCHRAGIRPAASIMMGAPMETREDLEKTYKLVKTIKPFNWQVHVTTPICGSYLYNQAKAENRLNSETDYGTSAPTGNIYRLHLPMKLDNLTVDDIAEYRDRINRYMKVRVLLKCLIDPRLWKEFFLSRGMRTIAINFIMRHFNLFGRTAQA
jgi:anaerobic magnesium-protoporphyrin IX monomethyl ester cyclase